MTTDSTNDTASKTYASSVDIAIVKHPFDQGERILVFRPVHNGKFASLRDDQKALVKALRGPGKTGFFTWSGAFFGYTCGYSDDMKLRIEQLGAVLEHLEKENPQAAPVKAAKEGKGISSDDFKAALLAMASK